MPQRHYLLVDQRQILTRASKVLRLSEADIGDIKIDAQAEYSLGSYHNIEWRLLIVSVVSVQNLMPDIEASAQLRTLLAEAEDLEFYTLLSRAIQLSAWHQEHRFCGLCGKPTEPHVKEQAKCCKSCNRFYYAPISPCIIVLVRKDDRCLLAHNIKAPAGRFSPLAGFMEAGETPEQTVVREVREEVGIEVKKIRYFSSQSWPFPNALMLAFVADYAAGDIQPDGIEIETADWFDVDELAQLHTPELFSVAGQLIEQFVVEQTAN